MSEHSRFGARLLAALAGAGLMALAAAPALANSPPRREGNIWDWRKHQPTQGSVSAKEHAAGVALPPAAKARTDRELGLLGQELLSRGTAGGSTAGTAGQMAR